MSHKKSPPVPAKKSSLAALGTLSTSNAKEDPDQSYIASLRGRLKSTSISSSESLDSTQPTQSKAKSAPKTGPKPGTIPVTYSKPIVDPKPVSAGEEPVEADKPAKKTPPKVQPRIQAKSKPSKPEQPVRRQPRAPAADPRLKSSAADEGTPPPLPRRREADASDEENSTEENSTEEEEEDAPPLPRRPELKEKPVMAKPTVKPPVRPKPSVKPKPISLGLNCSRGSPSPIPVSPSPVAMSPLAPRPQPGALPSVLFNSSSMSSPELSRSPSAHFESAKPTPPPVRPRAGTTDKPAPPQPRQSAWKNPDLDLEIPTCWFAKKGAVPQCFANCDVVSTRGSIGKNNYAIYSFRLADLSTANLKFTWKEDGGSPLDTLKQTIAFVPPPTATKKQLLEGHDKYGEHVASWCEVKKGQTVGDGECWTLAHDALQKGCGNYAFISSGLHHGALLGTFKSSGYVPESVTDTIKRGDILQFKSCFFQNPSGTQTFGSPDHTAIVVGVNGPKIDIIQQNQSGHKIVGLSSIDTTNLAGGELKVYRPIDGGWLVSLSESASDLL